ncbi:hypothetical protein AQUCO_04000021v1 [Aquilegia coerulea]|uniref:Uncharacterized protein n=1 Tax=Aquilegia coerulea TaxID=218851 RepID=A0A2G5CQY8_AQUCA|nr:hypothetical protein AQUCO_04000021v1 [Aquilegia coerulea]
MTLVIPNLSYLYATAYLSCILQCPSFLHDFVSLLLFITFAFPLEPWPHNLEHYPYFSISTRLPLFTSPNPYECI